MVLAIAGPSPSCSRCHDICSFVKIDQCTSSPEGFGGRFD
jgi:hypothetical protein